MHDNCVEFSQISNSAPVLHYFTFQKRGLRSAAISLWRQWNSLSFRVESSWVLMSLELWWMVTHSLSSPTSTNQRETVTFIEILKNSSPLCLSEKKATLMASETWLQFSEKMISTTWKTCFQIDFYFCKSYCYFSKLLEMLS